MSNEPMIPGTNEADNYQPSNNEKNWAALVHFSALVSAWAGGLAMIGPVVIWLIQRDSMPFVDQAGKDAINFNISWFIWTIVSAILILLLIGLVFLLIIAVAWLILVLVASVKALNGQRFKYPLTIQFLK